MGCGCVQRKILGGSARSEIHSFFVEGPLVPADKAEIVGRAQKEGILVGPFEHVQRNYAHFLLVIIIHFISDSKHSELLF